MAGLELIVQPKKKRTDDRLKVRYYLQVQREANQLRMVHHMTEKKALEVLIKAAWLGKPFEVLRKHVLMTGELNCPKGWSRPVSWTHSRGWRRECKGLHSALQT